MSDDNFVRLAYARAWAKTGFALQFGGRGQLRADRLGMRIGEAMCLAVPGKIESINAEDPVTRIGRVNFGGVVKEASLALVPEAEVGDYVIVHAGFAISRLDEAEAIKVFEYLKQMEQPAEPGLG